MRIRGEKAMKKVLVYLVLVIVFLILFMVDISNYDLQENETLSSVGMN